MFGGTRAQRKVGKGGDPVVEKRRLAIGLPLAYVMARTFATLLFGVAPADPATYALSAIALLLIAVAAALTPARRAARVDPIVALRAE